MKADYSQVVTLHSLYFLNCSQAEDNKVERNLRLFHVVCYIVFYRSTEYNYCSSYGDDNLTLLSIEFRFGAD